MKHIANILTDKKFIDNELYNVVSDKNDLISDIPTLVIGWEYTKKMYNNVNILDWKISDNIFWTFGNREKRQRYEETIIKFKEYAINKFVKSIKYKFISMLSNDGLNILLDILKNYKNIIIYLYNNMIYLTDKDKKVVYGFSLKEYEYLTNNRNELLNIIYNSENNIIDYKNNLSIDLKMALKNHNYVIPCLY